jgi:hypothetical protein
MAEGRVNITVSVEIDSGDDTPMEAVIKELASTCVVLSKEVVMIEPPEHIGVYDPQLEKVSICPDNADCSHDAMTGNDVDGWYCPNCERSIGNEELTDAEN